VIEMTAEPGTPGGVTAVTVVALTTVTFVAGAPPTVTDVAPVSAVPEIVIGVPPITGPKEGAIEVMVGAGAVYVNAPAAMATPPGVVTRMSFAPRLRPEGVTALTTVELTTVTAVAARPSMRTDVVFRRFSPVMVMRVPPVVGPDAGETLVTVGAVPERLRTTRKPTLFHQLPGASHGRNEERIQSLL
jgi:hypothetical protein